MNELIGSTILTIILLATIYFVIASKLKFGFDTTIVMTIPFLLVLGLTFVGFSSIFAFTTIIVALIFAALYNRLIGN